MQGDRERVEGGNGKEESSQGSASNSTISHTVPEVIELPPFTQKWGHYRLTESDRTIMLDAILSDPEAWAVQRGTAGARKARFSSHEMDCGSSGGYRVLYAAFPAYGKVVLVTLFSKSDSSNLSNAGQNLVSALLREIEVELARSLEKRRLARRKENGRGKHGPRRDIQEDHRRPQKRRTDGREPADRASALEGCEREACRGNRQMPRVPHDRLRSTPPLLGGVLAFHVCLGPGRLGETTAFGAGDGPPGCLLAAHAYLFHFLCGALDASSRAISPSSTSISARCGDKVLACIREI